MRDAYLLPRGGGPELTPDAAAPLDGEAVIEGDTWSRGWGEG